MKTTPISTLSPAKVKKCTQWLATNGIEACPVCGLKRLDIRDAVSARIVDADAMIPQQQGMVLVAVSCSRCLHVMFFDALRMGILGKGP